TLHKHPSTRPHAQSSSQRRMNLYPWLRLGAVELLDHPRLSAGVVMLLVPSGREVERVIRVRLLSGWAVNDGVEPRAAVGMSELLGEQSRRPGMVFARAWPEDAVFAVDAVVGDAGIIRRPARRRPAELLEHVSGGMEREFVAAAEAHGQLAQD